MINNYGWSGGTLPQSFGYVAPAVINLIRSSGASKVLDLGCGNGLLCRELDRLGFSVVGVEPALDGWTSAKETSPSITFYHLGAEDDPADLVAQEGLFDVVVSTEVVEHLYSPHLLPIFAWQCLKPGGIFIVSTPYHGYVKNFVISLLGKWDRHHTVLWCGGHIKFWSRNTLTRLLSNADFVIKSFHGVGRFPWLWKSMILVSQKPLD